METKTKRNLTIWAIVLLVVLNLSSLGTIWFHRYQFRKNNRVEQKDRRFESRRGEMNQRLGKMPPFLDKALSLSKEQKVVIDSIWNHFNTQRRTLEDSMGQTRFEMFSIMMQEEIDTNRYNELSESQGLLLREINDTMLAMNRSMRENLTEDQQLILKEKLIEMRHRKPQERRRRTRK